MPKIEQRTTTYENAHDYEIVQALVERRDFWRDAQVKIKEAAPESVDEINMRGYHVDAVRRRFAGH